MSVRDYMSSGTTRKGEPLVWVTSVGLAIGIILIVSLLSWIFVQGIGVFYPKEVVQYTLEDGTRVVGERWEIRHTRTPQGMRKEARLYIANRHENGHSFRFVDFAEVTATDYPRDVCKAERQSEAFSIGTPVSLIPAEGEPIAADSAAFASTWKTVQQDMAALREEKQARLGVQGKLSNKQREIKIDLYRARNSTPDPAAEERLVKQNDGLSEESSQLKAEVEELDAQLAATTLRLRIADGREVDIPAGDIIGFYYPNQLGFTGRLGRTALGFWHFLTRNPRNSNQNGGVFPAIFGTFVMTVLMSLAVTPFGVVTAIYLREYARDGLLVRTVRIAINNLAGVPSIVFGVFGLGFFIWTLGAQIDDVFFADQVAATNQPVFGTGGVLWASLTLALLTVPVVIVASEEALAAVPRGMREGALACGASKWQTIQSVVLPAAAPGILTGVILAMARGAGEVAPLMLVGVMKIATDLPVSTEFPFVHLDQKFMHLGFHIYDLGFQSPDVEAAIPMVYATTMLLIAIVVVLNSGGILIRERLRRKYATGAF